GVPVPAADPSPRAPAGPPEHPPPTAPVTTQPPATTPTTEPPASTTADLASSVWEMTPEQLAERWDAVARPLSSTLTSSNLTVDGGRFSFSAGLFVRIEGDLADGKVRRVTFIGDPS